MRIQSSTGRLDVISEFPRYDSNTLWDKFNFNKLVVLDSAEMLSLNVVIPTWLSVVTSTSPRFSFQLDPHGVRNDCARKTSHQRTQCRLFDHCTGAIHRFKELQVQRRYIRTLVVSATVTSNLDESHYFSRSHSISLAWNSVLDPGSCTAESSGPLDRSAKSVLKTLSVMQVSDCGTYVIYGGHVSNFTFKSRRR